MRIKNKKKLIIWGVVVLAAIFAILHFTKGGEDEDKMRYVTEPVKRGNIESTVLATGILQPYKSVLVGAQASGQISKLFVDIGDHVKKGDIIAEIDPRTQENKLKNVEAQIAETKAAQKSITASLDLAKMEFSRQAQMLKDGATSRQLYDSAKNKVATVSAQLEQSKAQLKRLDIALEDAKLELGYTKVTSPIDGVIVNVRVEEGNTLNASMSSPTIATVSQVDKMLLKAEISEADVTKVKPGMRAWFTLVGNSVKKYDTKLDSVDPAPVGVSDGTSSSSAVYYYGRFTTPNEDGSIKINMTANVNIVLGEAKDVLVVPALALEKSVEEVKNSVKVMNADGTIKSQPVEIGLTDGINVEIKSGLTEGQKIVLGGGRASESGMGFMDPGPAPKKKKK